jgi:hypothetical protein
MSIEKITKMTLQHEPQPFTTMFNEVLQGIKNTAALGVYCYLASKPSGWNISKVELQAHFDCGEKHIRSCFKYLKTIGAIETIANKDENGRFTEWITVLKRSLNKEQSSMPKMDIVEDVQCGKGSTIKERDIQIKDITTKTPNATAFDDADILRKYEIKPPKALTTVHKRYIKKAKDILAENNLNLEDYLNYLTNRCPRALLPYLTNGVERQNGFGNILRPSFIYDVLNGKWVG